MALTQVLLTSGRSIALAQVRFSSTYGGMLEGYPFRRWNDHQLGSLLKRTEQQFGSTPVHLVEPTREYPDERAGAFGPMELLPAVTCVGLFTSHPVDPALEAPVLWESSLAVVWFQAVPVVPAGEDADPLLRAIPWDELARDSER
jgi:hypothetical protein